MSEPTKKYQERAREIAIKVARHYYNPLELGFHNHVDLILKETNLAELLADRARLNFAILYPRKFTYLIETRAHGGFPEQEKERGRQIVDEAIKKQKE